MAGEDDADRQQVYLCEDRLVAIIDQGVPVRSGTVVLHPEPDHRFSSLAEASLFCTLTCAELGLPPVRVRLRGGDRQSHYSPAGSRASGGQPEIALASWGSSRLVVVHELAHHLVHERHPGVASHGREFRDALLAILQHLGLPGQATTLRHCFASTGLSIGVPT